MQYYYKHNYFLYFCAIVMNFTFYVYFMVHIVTVFFCMQINKYTRVGGNRVGLMQAPI